MLSKKKKAGYKLYLLDYCDHANNIFMHINKHWEYIIWRVVLYSITIGDFFLIY